MAQGSAIRPLLPWIEVLRVDQRALNNLSLCSGGAGLDLGLELALGSLRTVCWVEWEAFACEYLATAMEAGCLVQAPLWTDLRTFDGRPWRGVVDCLTAGYPCQPFSVAGKRRGQDDPRHLWPHVRRVIGEVEPSIVFLENVPGHFSPGFAQVAADLESMGYEVAAGLFTAEEVGASHRRERLFILAVAQSDQLPAGSGCQQAGDEKRRCGDGGESTPLSERPSSNGWIAPADQALADHQGERWREGRAEPEGRKGQPVSSDAGVALAHAAHDHRRGGVGRAEEGTGADGLGRRRSASRGPELADPEGRGTVPVQQPGRSCRALPLRDDMADAIHAGLSDAQQPGLPAAAQCRLETGPAVEQFCFPQLFPPRPDDFDRWREVLGIDGALAPAQSAVRLLADGLAEDRARWLRLYGNGVVPLQAAYAFCSLWAALRLGR